MGRMLISYLLASSENQTLYPLDFLVRMDSLFVLCKDADATCHAVHLLQGNYKTGHSFAAKQEPQSSCSSVQHSFIYYPRVVTTEP